MTTVRAAVTFELWIPGWPRTKGSLAPQRVRDGAGRLTGRIRLVDTDESKRWRRTVAKAIKAEMSLREGNGVPIVFSAGTEVCCVETYFTPWHPLERMAGDIEKLVRNVHDAMTDAKLWRDDSQCTHQVVDEQWAQGKPHGPGVYLVAYARGIGVGRLA